MKARIQVRDVMTRMPHGISIDQSLAEASARMRKLKARHLPVTRDGELVGLLSERDLELAAGLGASLEAVAVGVAMSSDPYAVGPEVPLVQVIRCMAERKLGCALVMDDGLVIGIVTTTDALRLLEHTLDKEGLVEPKELFPSEVRVRLSREHSLLRSMADKVRKEAKAALIADANDASALRRDAGVLYRALLHHITLEDEILTPVLREIPVSGPIRAGILLDKHALQRSSLEMAQARLDTADVKRLANSLLLLSDVLETEFAEEEKWVINAHVLHDDLVQEGASDG